MNEPANRCGCTHTHTYIFTKEKLAKVAKVCLSYSKLENKKVCKLNFNIQNKICKNDNKKIKSKKHYEYMKIGVV